LREHTSSPKLRPYHMRKRAEQVEETRKRIVDATVQLHSTVGPANTTISAIADQAGVTRLTVYRHFPDQEALFAACSQEWDRRHPPPDPSSWRDINGLEERAGHALAELYAWYRQHGDQLLPLYRDIEAWPVTVQEAARAETAALVEALVAGSGVRGAARRRVKATAGHAVSFWTWRSLTVEHGLDDAEAADLAAALLVEAARTGARTQR
jgi:AcrR family transcriptional regulator